MTDNRVDIRDRVARHDLRYDAVPCTYFEGFILGNGDLGAVLWFEEDCMVLSLDKADVWERRADQSLEPGMDYRTALQQVRTSSFDPSCRIFDPVRPPDRVWGNKLPIGRVEWPLGQTPIALEGKIALYEAAFSLELRLAQGALTVWGVPARRRKYRRDRSGGARQDPTTRLPSRPPLGRAQRGDRANMGLSRARVWRPGDRPLLGAGIQRRRAVRGIRPPVPCREQPCLLRCHGDPRCGRR